MGTLTVPKQLYQDRFIPPPPLRIEDQKGNLLSTISFMPWQDGGVILLRGKLPLDGLLIFLGRTSFQRAGVIRRPTDLQISYVLPITVENFREMLRRIQAQSNMVIRADEGKWVIQKVADEGTATPFIARLFLGILRLRDLVYSDDDREGFDEQFELVSSSLTSAREAVKEITRVWREHVEKLEKGSIAKSDRRTIRLAESIDRDMRKHSEDFLNACVRALKQGMQNVASVFGVNIAFLFKKQSAFDKGIAVLAATDPMLADYLVKTRQHWSESLVNARNAVEHDGWMLPKVVYKEVNSRITATEPEINGQPVTGFAEFMLDRLCCFVEELTAHCVQSKLSKQLTITEVETANRAPEAPQRFSLTTALGGLPRWGITYGEARFEDK